MSLDWWIEVVVKVLLVFIVVLTSVAYMVLLERRVLALIQSRIGPNRVGPQGLLQPAADALKLMTKETVFPEAADKMLFLVAPVFTMVPALVAFSVIPFGDTVVLFGREVRMHITDVNVAAVFLLALSETIEPSTMVSRHTTGGALKPSPRPYFTSPKPTLRSTIPSLPNFGSSFPVFASIDASWRPPVAIKIRSASPLVQ